MNMMFRRIVSLVLTVQLLLTQLMACHCNATGHASCGGSTPHIHLSSLPGGKAAGGHSHAGHSHAGHSHGHGHSHCHSHGHDEAEEETGPGSDDGTEEMPCSGHEDGRPCDAYHLPDGWHAERPSVRVVGGTFVFAFVLPDLLDLSRLLAAGARISCNVPPDPEPPGLPVYLRTLRIRV